VCSYECWPGWVDDPTQGGTDDDCLYECTPAGGEICNNIDDDCDKQTDELSDMTAPDPGTYCKNVGVCDGNSGEVAVFCDAANGWQCDYDSVSDYETDESLCDALDNDCDGKTDEMYAYLYPPSPCSVGQGGCREDGVWICDGNPLASPICNVVEGPPQPEVCNGIDDDCDGKVDEPCPSPTDTSEANSDGPSCVQDVWVQLPSGTYIYAYEAVRPDAGTGAFNGLKAAMEDWDTGTSGARACSRAGWDDGALPWTNVTYDRAEDACSDAGARLCTEAEWEEACMFYNGTAAFCDWSYSHPTPSCLVYGAGDTCNGNDYDADSDTAGDQDLVQPTGWMASCYRDYTGFGGPGEVFDLSGNVKEWVLGPSSPATNPLRGGAMDSTDRGISCAFDFVEIDNPDYSYFNTGFRCCYGP
jgi:hypothetical protein